MQPININNNASNKLNWIYMAGFFIILALPLLSLPPWFSPPDFGKTVIFRIIMSVLIFASLYQILFQKKQNKEKNQNEQENRRSRFPTIVGNLLRRKNPIFLPFWLLVGLLGIYFLATLFSPDILFSLWGSPYRAGGFVNFALYIILAILAFFTLKKTDWKKIWIFSFITGDLVCLIALLQQYKIFSPLLFSYEGRAPSTIGNPITLAVYLLLLIFLALSFGLKTKKLAGKLFYFLSFLFFIWTAVFITETRAVYLGLAAGLVYFLIFYPFKGKRLAIGLKISTVLFLILTLFAIYYINTTPQLKFPEIIESNRYIKGVIGRLSFESAVADPRFSAWKVAWSAIKEKPLLGYGPENFNIGFDKFYDPSLPHISHDIGSWYDRAHNFILDIATTAGIPALLIYFALFTTLFWQLQKLKLNQRESDIISGNQIIAHGIQATFIGYFVANFFSFDSFSSYLISFLLIGYSLHIISLNAVNKEKSAEETLNNAEQFSVVQRKVQRYFSGNKKKTTIIILIILLVWLNWQYNIKPLNINTQINVSKYLAENKKCEEAFSLMEKTVLPQKSILNFYSKGKYTDFLIACESYYPDKTEEFAKRGFETIKDVAKIRPLFVRSWLFLSGFNTVLINTEQDLNKKVELIKAGEEYLKKAEALAPKRQEVFVEWSKYAFTSDRYDLLKEKSQKCVDTNPNTGDCYWYNGLAEIALGNLEQGESLIKTAVEKGYNAEIFIPLGQLEKVYTIAKDYNELVVIYQKLIALKPEEPQYHATLAFVYKELGKIKEARAEAMEVLELQPEARDMVNEFLKTLK